MSTPNAVLLFAAGLGTRMLPLTKTTPKPLIKVAGRTLIDHALDQFAPLDLHRLVVNTHHKAEMLTAHLSGTAIKFSHEETQALETGGGLKHALPLLGAGPVYTMNTDAVWRGPNPVEPLRNAWNSEHMDALLLCIPQERSHGHKGKGSFIMNDQGQLSIGPGVNYTGLQIIKPDLVSTIEKTVFSMWDLWTPMLENGRMYGVTYDGHWCDVGYPEAIEIAERVLTDV